MPTATDFSTVRPTTFFTLTFTLPWAVWLPLFLSKYGVGFALAANASALLRLVGVLMPAAPPLVSRHAPAGVASGCSLPASQCGASDGVGGS